MPTTCRARSWTFGRTADRQAERARRGVEGAFQPAKPYCDIEFSLPRFRYSSDKNFSGAVEYRHSGGEGAFEPQNFRWSDISGLVPRDLASDRGQICERVRRRFGFLADLDEPERRLLDDQVAHRELRLFGQLRKDAREVAGKVRNI